MHGRLIKHTCDHNVAKIGYLATPLRSGIWELKIMISLSKIHPGPASAGIAPGIARGELVARSACTSAAISLEWLVKLVSSVVRREIVSVYM